MTERGSVLAGVKAVLFDVYGTLVQITDKRAPFKQLLRLGEQQGRPATAADAVTLMSTPLTLREAADRLGIGLTNAQAVHLENDLQAELASVRLFSDVLETLDELKQRSVKLGLCSNLAADYAIPVVTLLQGQLDVLVWSFEAGAIKPDRAIYAQSCTRLACAATDVLMVGDSYAADVAGPRAYGMQAVLLQRARARPADDALASLSDLLSILGK